MVETAEHLDTTLFADGSVDSESTAATYVGVRAGGIKGGSEDRGSDAMLDSSREWWSRGSTWTRLCSPTAVSTVDRLPPRVLVSVEAAALSSDSSRDGGVGGAVGHSSAR